MTIDDTTAAATAPADHAGAAIRARDRSVVLLAALSGATDAIGLMALGGAFTSVMTGNMVLVGVAAGTGDASALGLIATAIGCYVLGVYVGARVAGEPAPDQHPWPRGVTRALVVELVAFGAFAAAWWGQGGSPSAGWFGPMLGVLALALGVQSSAILRFGVAGLSTTYMTGTLTAVVTKLAARHPVTSVRTSAVLLGALIAGAALVGLTWEVVPLAVPVLQLALIGAAVVIGLLRGSRD